MRLIKPAIVVLALTVLVTSIGSLLLGWQLNSLTSSLCMLLLGLILPELVLLSYVLVRSLRDRRPREVAASNPSPR